MFTAKSYTGKRLLNLAIVDEDDKCWIWKGAKVSNGRGGEYGYFRLNGKSELAHRVSFAIFRNKGKFPEDNVLHCCDITLCINFNHLFTGTQQDNVNDMLAKGREARGINHGHSKLTREKVLKIRELCKFMVDNKIAARFGVSYSCIARIRKGESYTNVI